MKINDLKEELDKLVEDGCGDMEIRITEPTNDISYLEIKNIRFEDVLYYENGELHPKTLLVLYAGEYEE